MAYYWVDCDVLKFAKYVAEQSIKLSAMITNSETGVKIPVYNELKLKKESGNIIWIGHDFLIRSSAWNSPRVTCLETKTCINVLIVVIKRISF